MIYHGGPLSLAMFGELRNPRNYLLGFYPDAPIPPLDHIVWTAKPLVAKVNHSIWVASCDCGAKGTPTPGCVVFMGLLLGWCVRCQNGGTGRGWRLIAVPSQEERAEIERVLLCRPNPDDRNWEVGETIADLLAQNIEHGDPIPAEAA